MTTEVDEKVQSMSVLVLRKFMEHKMAVISLAVIMCFTAIAVLAPWIGKAFRLDPENQNALFRYLPLGTSTISEVYQRTQELDLWLETHREELESVLNTLNLDSYETLTQWLEGDWTVLEPQIKPLLENQTLPPHFRRMIRNLETFHVFGTDELGRDVGIRLVYGARVSLGVGVLVALAAAIIGLMMGCLAGFYDGWVDTLLMRFTDSLLSLPQVPVLIVVAAIDFEKIPYLADVTDSNNQSIVKMILILCLFSWMQVARLVRANVLSLREREFILAARTLGAKDRQLILWHLFPNVIGPMLVAVSLGIGNAILFESILSFLGLGIQPPTASWGNMLFNAQELVSEAPFLAIAPGVLILITIVCFNYIGDGLQDALDPKALQR